jgi:hypothetical protein
MRSIRENKLRDEFISKLSQIYNNKPGQVDIKILWKWIKDLIKFNNNQSFKKNEVYHFK